MVVRSVLLVAVLVAVGQANTELKECFDNCTKSLKLKEPKEIQQCQNACGVNQRQPLGLQSMLQGLFNDNFFSDGDDSHRNGGLTISFGLPEEDWGMPNWVHQHVGQMMKQMNQQMGQMMQSMKSGAGDIMSGGKMYVMKSGPGYHEEKTYDIGPEGQMTLIENDQMAKVNELEDKMEDHDVEVFDPEMLMKGFEKQVRETSEREEDNEKWIEEMDQELVNHMVNDLEGPQLPETGLRSKPKDSLCRMDGLQWSEWSKCLHLNMGMPKWLVISSLCLGIIFLLWLCLVIPSNAPKQRVKKIPDLKAKEVEAFAIVTEKSPQYPNDLPPAYEDVANMKVSLEPLNETKIEKA